MNLRQFIASFLTILMVPLAAHAALGETSSSVTIDQVKMRASLASTMKSSYTDHTITKSDGLVVHEYSRSDGTIFAVGWTGPYKPDLQQLLGNYFSSYTSAAQQSMATKGRSLSQFHSTQSGLVIHESGRMRAFSGIVYLPDLVPSGINADQLQ